MLCSIGYIWWPYAFLSNCPLNDPLLPLHDFKPSDALHSGLGFFSIKFGGHRTFLKYLTSGWPRLDPFRPLTPAMSYTLIRGSFYQICGPTAFLSHLTSSWPRLTPAWPLTPAMHYTLVRVLPTKCGGHRALLSKLTPTRPSWPLHNLNPTNALHYGQEFFPPNLVAVGHCCLNWPLLDPRWPLHDLWPSNACHCVQGFFPPNWWSLGKLTLLDPSWPLHDLWPQQCITLWSGILPTKFGGHRAFLSNLTPGWPQMAPTWPLTPVMHYTVVRGSTHQLW